MLLICNGGRGDASNPLSFHGENREIKVYDLRQHRIKSQPAPTDPGAFQIDYLVLVG